MSSVFRLFGKHQAERLLPDGGVEIAPLSEIATSRTRPTLIVPGEAVTLYQMQLPGRAAARWRQAAPYALEERLADGVERTHVALGDAPAAPATGGTAATDIAAAVIARDVLRGWLDDCRAASVVPAAAIPDMLLLPLYENAWTVLGEGQRCLLRSGPYQGFSCENSAFTELLALALEASSATLPEQRVCYGNVPDAVTAAAVAAGVTVRSGDAAGTEQAPLALLAASAASRQPQINLLQGEFAARSNRTLTRRTRGWRLAAALAAACVVLVLVGKGLQVRELRQQQVLLDEQIEALFRQALPDVRRVVNPRAQLQNRLNQLQAATGQTSGGFLTLLDAGGRGLRDLPGTATVDLRGLRFGQGQLELLLHGRRLQDFDLLERGLQEFEGIRAKFNTRMRDGAVESRLSLAQE